MQQYFIKQIDLKNKQATITGRDVHHITNVMRFRVGDEIIVCADNMCYTSKIIKLTNTEVLVTIKNRRASTELSTQVDLAQALIKKDNFELVLQKASELGVHHIYPLQTHRSIIQIKPNKVAQKVVRWNTITKEACEQSKRTHLVSVSEPVSIKALKIQDYDAVYVLYAKEETNVFQYNPNVKQDRILIIVGPEGGFTDEEIGLFKELPSTHIVSIGNRILRSETASLFFLSVIGYHDLGSDVE